MPATPQSLSDSATCPGISWRRGCPSKLRPAEAARRAAAEVAAITFRAAATDYVAAHEAGWKNEKHRAQWTSTLATYAYPVFGTQRW